MSCEHLICASCASPVAEGRCSACRASRAELHTHGPHISPQFVLVFALLLIAALFFALNAAG
ncbi:MAG: hypothetical protein QOG53_1215 [Frankiales bacterium]|nr:hypothetical protein [Frankiales bacterium]